MYAEPKTNFSLLSIICVRVRNKLKQLYSRLFYQKNRFIQERQTIVIWDTRQCKPHAHPAKKKDGKLFRRREGKVINKKSTEGNGEFEV